MVESKSQPKQKVNWTLDVDAIEFVREQAQQIAESTGMKVSESAAANRIIKQSKKDTNNGKKTS